MSQLDPDQYVIVVEEVVKQTVEILAQGPQGPRGVAGGEGLGNLPLDFQDVQVGDVVIFNGSAWTNENKNKISDGGNF